MTITHSAKHSLAAARNQSSNTVKNARRTAFWPAIQPRLPQRNLSQSHSPSIAALPPPMSLQRFKSPFEALLAHHSLLSNALDSHVDASETGGRHHSLWQPHFLNAPRVDVHELEGSFELSAEMPGFKKDDVNLQVDEKTRKITISGESKSEYDSRNEQSGGEAVDDNNNNKHAADKKAAAKAIVTERTYGYCSRSFMLPESADLTQVKAKFDNGVLKVTVPKVVKAKVEPRKVTIEDGGEE